MSSSGTAFTFCGAASTVAFSSGIVHAEPVAAGPSLVQDQKVCKTHLKVQMEIPQGSLLFKEIKTEVRSRSRVTEKEFCQQFLLTSSTNISRLWMTGTTCSKIDHTIMKKDHDFFRFDTTTASTTLPLQFSSREKKVRKQQQQHCCCHNKR